MAEWIGVKDRLPEKHKPDFDYESNVVLLYVEDYDEMRTGYYDYQFHEFYTVDDIILGGVTHWMPLPEPPEEGDKDG